MVSAATISDHYEVHNRLKQIFYDAQGSALQHRRLSKITQKLVHSSSTSALLGSFQKILSCILTVKKSQTNGDRSLAFFAEVLRTLRQKPSPSNFSLDELVNGLIQFFMQGIQTKDKVVRYRVVQIIAICTIGLSEIDNALFQDLVNSLCLRINDREANIRVQASVALCRLQGGNDEDDLTHRIRDTLLSSLQEDPSPDVRRTILLGLEQNRETLPFLLERARDIDTVCRALVYKRCLSEFGDFRKLSIKKRERLIGWGLNDRAISVQKATNKLFAHEWLQYVNGNVLELLKEMDVLHSKVVEQALFLLFDEHQSLITQVKFSSDFWTQIIPESALLAATFFKFCHSRDNLANFFEEMMPSLTLLSALITEQVEKLKLYREANNILEAQKSDFILCRLLEISQIADLADEAGRRKLFASTRALLQVYYLSDLVIENVVNTLAILTNNSSDFSGLIMENLSDLQDLLSENIEIDDTLSSQDDSSSFIANSLAVNKDEDNDKIITLRMLQITLIMLRNVKDSPLHNSRLKDIFESVIIPHIRDSRLEVQVKAIQCFGLYSTLSTQNSVENTEFVFECLESENILLKITCIECLTDMVICGGFSMVMKSQVKIDQIEQKFSSLLETVQDPELLNTVAIACSKLFLLSFFQSKTLLSTMIVAYFNPINQNNNAFQQCLAYFFPVFCYSDPRHQTILRDVAISSFREICNLTQRNVPTEKAFSISTILSQLIDWTNPSNSSVFKDEELDKETEPENVHLNDSHISIAAEICELLWESRSKSQRQALISSLSKLHVPQGLDLDEKTEGLKQRLRELQNPDITPESLSRNALQKFEQTINRSLESRKTKSTTSERSVNASEVASEA